MLTVAMEWGSFRLSILFLSAAIVALVLYRVLETGLGFTSTAIFANGLYGAALVATPLSVSWLLSKQRQRNK